MVGVEAINEIGARVQDLVEVEIPSGEVVKSSMVVYLLPVLMLIVGYLIGAAGARWMVSETLSEVYGIMFAIVFLMFSFFVVRWYDKNIERKSALRAKIVRKI
jgi:sigma-E factor negative regulatory protein RseC